MTKHERYQKAEYELKTVVNTLSLIIENDEEGIACYFAKALDEPIQQLIEAKMHMAVAENMENIQEKFRKMFAKENAEYGGKLRDSISKSVSKEV